MKTETEKLFIKLLVTVSMAFALGMVAMHLVDKVIN
jgi:hypothetical protein